MTTSINYTVTDGVARIAMDRGPVNAITHAFLIDLIAAIEKADKDPAIGAIVLASDVAGRFCAGLDLPYVQSCDKDQIRAILSDLYTRLYDVQHKLSKPTIAEVNGTARGGGVTLAISCDVLVAADDATFGYPEIELGLPPAIHFAHLPRIIGRHRAFELLFTGRAFSAQEAQTLGLVSRVCDPTALGDEAMALATQLASKPGMKLARAAFMRQNDFDYRRSIAVAVEDFCNAFDTAEARVRLDAFVEKLAVKRRS